MGERGSPTGHSGASFPAFLGRVTWVNEGVIDGSMPCSVTKEVGKLLVNSRGIQLLVCIPRWCR